MGRDARAGSRREPARSGRSGHGLDGGGDQQGQLGSGAGARQGKALGSALEEALERDRIHQHQGGQGPCVGRRRLPRALRLRRHGAKATGEPREPAHLGRRGDSGACPRRLGAHRDPGRRRHHEGGRQEPSGDRRRGVRHAQGREALLHAVGEEPAPGGAAVHAEWCRTPFREAGGSRQSAGRQK